MKFNRYVAPPTSLLNCGEARVNADIGTSIKTLIESEVFSAASEFTAVLGRADDGSAWMLDLKKCPHLIIGGQTGTGKSTLLNSVVVSLTYKCSPDELRFVFIDPKYIEFNMFRGLPHSLTDGPINSVEKADAVFRWAVEEMERRYELFVKCKCVRIDDYNSRVEVISGAEKKLPRVVIIVDEYADLAVSACRKTIEANIVRLLQKARACGLHIILATQRPSSDVVSSVIKSNICDRIAFKTSSSVDSRIILDCAGAEKLTQRGEMLCSFSYLVDAVKLKCAYVGSAIIHGVVKFLSSNAPAEPDEKLNKLLSEDDGCEHIDETPWSSDPLFASVLWHFVKSGNASISSAQRRFSIGYARAARLMDSMEQQGLVTPSTGSSKPRKVLISKARYCELFGNECILDECVDYTSDAKDGGSDGNSEDDSSIYDLIFPRIVEEIDMDEGIIDAAEVNNTVFPHKDGDNGTAAVKSVDVPQFADAESKALFVNVLKHVSEKGIASTADVQYCLGLSYIKTLRLFELMEKYGYIGPKTEIGFDREVIITAAQIKELFGE